MPLCVLTPHLTHAKGYRNILSSEMVTIRVGAEQVAYRVHEAVLTHHSGYFSGVLRSRMEEARTRAFALEDIEPHVFVAFVDWLYTQVLPSDGDLQRRYYPESTDIRRDAFLVSLYAFADRFLVPILKPAIIARLVDCFNILPRPSPAAITLAFNNLPAGNPVQKLLVDVYRRAGRAAIFENDLQIMENLPPTFLCQVLIKYAADTDLDMSPLDAAKYQEGD